MQKLKIGSLVYNPKTFPHFPGVPDFKKGYYAITKIDEGLSPSKMEPEKKLAYYIHHISKDGMKYFKYRGVFYCKGFDKWIEEKKIQIVTL